MNIKLSDIIPNLEQRKQAGQVITKPLPASEELKKPERVEITIKRFDPQTGAELPPHVIEPEKQALLDHKAELQAEMDTINNLLGEFK